MKKAMGVICFSVSIVLMISSSIFAKESEGNTCRIYGSDVLVTFPEEYIGFSKDLDSINAASSALGYSIDILYGYLYETSSDLTAISTDPDREFQVFLSGPSGTFHEMTGEEFEKYYTEKKTDIEAAVQGEPGVSELLFTRPLVTDEFNGVLYSAYWVEQNKIQVSFMTDAPEYNMDIHMSFSPKAAEVSEEERDSFVAEFQQIVESMKKTGPESPEETYKVLFPAAGAVLEVPDRWRSTTAVNNGIEMLQIENKSLPGSDDRILVLMQDVYEFAQMDGFEDSREALDKVYLDDTVMAAAVGIDRSEVQTEIFGDYKYFLTRNEDEDGVLLQYYIVKNGVLYMFQFNKDTDSEYYPVFENLLRTVDYPSN